MARRKKTPPASDTSSVLKHPEATALPSPPADTEEPSPKVGAVDTRGMLPLPTTHFPFGNFSTADRDAYLEAFKWLVTTKRPLMTFHQVVFELATHVPLAPTASEPPSEDDQSRHRRHLAQFFEVNVGEWYRTQVAFRSFELHSYPHEEFPSAAHIIDAIEYAIAECNNVVSRLESHDELHERDPELNLALGLRPVQRTIEEQTEFRCPDATTPGEFILSFFETYPGPSANRLHRELSNLFARLRKPDKSLYHPLTDELLRERDPRTGLVPGELVEHEDETTHGGEVATQETQRTQARADRTISLDQVTASRIAIATTRKELLAIVESKGQSLQQIGAHMGVSDPGVLDNLRFIGPTTATQFLDGLSRQRLHELSTKYGLGTLIDNQTRYSVSELVAFKLTERPSHRPRSS